MERMAGAGGQSRLDTIGRQQAMLESLQRNLKQQIQVRAEGGRKLLLDQVMAKCLWQAASYAGEPAAQPEATDTGVCKGVESFCLIELCICVAGAPPFCMC